MDKIQFDKLMQMLQGVRNDINGDSRVEDKEDTNIDIDQIREAFFFLLERKTGWGKNEIKEIFEQAVETLDIPSHIFKD